MIIVIDYTLTGIMMHSPSKNFWMFLDEQRENILHFHNKNESGSALWCDGKDLLDAMIFITEYFENRNVYPNFIIGGFNPNAK